MGGFALWSDGELTPRGGVEHTVGSTPASRDDALRSGSPGTARQRNDPRCSWRSEAKQASRARTARDAYAQRRGRPRQRRIRRCSWRCGAKRASRVGGTRLPVCPSPGYAVGTSDLGESPPMYRASVGPRGVSPSWHGSPSGPPGGEPREAELSTRLQHPGQREPSIQLTVARVLRVSAKIRDAAGAAQRSKRREPSAPVMPKAQRRDRPRQRPFHDAAGGAQRSRHRETDQRPRGNLPEAAGHHFKVVSCGWRP